MISIELLLTVALITSILHIKSDAINIKCDYDKHSITGCESGAICDQRLKECICRPGYAKTENGECVQKRAINESCTSSKQCQTSNSECVAEDVNYSQKKCQCRQGYWFDEKFSQCLQKYNFGKACRSDLQCRNGLICSAEENENYTFCKCPADYRYNSTINECQHLSNSGCPDGQQWNQYNNKCEPNHYSNRSGLENSGKSNAIIKNSKLMRPPGYWATTSTAVKDEDTDEKILEIILEISFLIVCLLAYQACSKACCPDDSDDDVDVKSDEESMISTTKNFKKSHRRVRKVFCKSRANSTQRLIGTPVHKYKNIIVKFDDNTRAPCYNCRIYKEVYSPTAKCKVCRSSITADDETSYTSDGKSVLLPLPPYKLKPIRRSEEVGVPPHLKAPYINNQPFWLK